MSVFSICFISGASFLLSFLLFFHPFRQNTTANRWLSLFAFVIGCAFISIYMTKTGATNTNSLVFKTLNSVQFLLAPSLYIGTLYFVNPTKVLRKVEYLHFVPFLIYSYAENIYCYGKGSISAYPVFVVNNDVTFLVRDFLPFQMLAYLTKCYISVRKHKSNLKLISSSISQINLNWLIQFYVIITITVIIWINDALFEFPFLTEATPFVYTASIFFLAYFSIKQKTIFDFKKKDINEISNILKQEPPPEVNMASETVPDAEIRENSIEKKEIEENKPKVRRLSNEQVAALSAQLSTLMLNEKIYLDNDLSLPDVAEKLGISIHEASFLINETTDDNFYTFINRYRVEEAKRLLTSSKIEELNILGIAFASGFNSKTTFNTTFKKMVGISPSQYSKEQKK